MYYYIEAFPHHEYGVSFYIIYSAKLYLIIINFLQQEFPLQEEFWERKNEVYSIDYETWIREDGSCSWTSRSPRLS